MDKFEYVNELLSFYQDLLTDKQKEILHQYYYEDFSLSEIAENMGISRNAVHDSMKKSINTMEKYESVLNMNEDYKKRNDIYQQLERLEISDVNTLVEKLRKLEE